MAWDDIKAPEQGRNFDDEKFEYMKLEVGKEVKLRVMNEPVQKLQFYVTGVPGVNYGGKKGIFVAKTPLTSAWVAKHNDNVTDAKQRIKLNKQFGILVYDYSDGKVKLVQKGWALFGELVKYHKNPEYGDLTNYDITVTLMTKDGKDYSVVPARNNTPLTDEQEKIAESLPTPEVFEKIVNPDIKEAVWMEALSGAMSIQEAFKKHYPKDGEAPAEKVEKAETDNSVEADDSKLSADDLKGYDLG